MFFPLQVNVDGEGGGEGGGGGKLSEKKKKKKRKNIKDLVQIHSHCCGNKQAAVKGPSPKPQAGRSKLNNYSVGVLKN